MDSTELCFLTRNIRYVTKCGQPCSQTTDDTVRRGGHLTRTDATLVVLKQLLAQIGLDARVRFEFTFRVMALRDKFLKPKANLLTVSGYAVVIVVFLFGALFLSANTIPGARVLVNSRATTYSEFARYLERHPLQSRGLYEARDIAHGHCAEISSAKW
jgi:hypothetical protein